MKIQPKYLYALGLIITAGALGFWLSHVGRPLEAAAPKIGLLGTDTASLEAVFEGFKIESDALNQANHKDTSYDEVMIGPTYDSEVIRHAAAYLISTGVDLLVTSTTQADILKNDSTLKIPVIAVLAYEPENPDLLAKGTGSNFLYIGSLNQSNTAKRLEIYKQLNPAFKSVLILRANPNLPGESNLGFDGVEAFAQKNRIQVIDRQFNSTQEFKQYLTTSEEKADVIVRYPSTLISADLDLLYAYSKKVKVPVIGFYEQDVSRGALFGYGPDLTVMGKQAADLAYKILYENLNPGTVAFVKPSKILLGLNLKQIALYNLKIPETLQKSANYVSN